MRTVSSDSGTFFNLKESLSLLLFTYFISKVTRLYLWLLLVCSGRARYARLHLTGLEQPTAVQPTNEGASPQPGALLL
jgi:hypothetical protein